MWATGDLKISSRGQMSLPASARRRWGLNEGGDVGYLDLGDALVLIPGGVDELRSALLGAVEDDVWTAARHGFGDPDLEALDDSPVGHLNEIKRARLDEAVRYALDIVY